jgi:hypothetical protein
MLNQFWIVKHSPARLYVTALKLYCFQRRESIIVLTVGPRTPTVQTVIISQTHRDLASGKQSFGQNEQVICEFPWKILSGLNGTFDFGV